jgi:signal transduction histidine kinase
LGQSLIGASVPLRNVMGSNSHESEVGVASASTAPREITRKPEEVDFEKLLGDLSAAFIRVSVDEIDREIERWLERIVLAMNVDRSTVVQADLADGGLYTTHQCAREGLPAPERGRRVEDTESYPWLARQVRSGEVVVISRLDEMPPEASMDRESFIRDGNKSNVTIPLRIAGVVVGALMFGTLISEREWSQKDVQRLKLVAEIFGNALERRRAEAEIRRLSQELQQVSQVVTMGALTAALAHELNQPLAAILGNARAVRRMLAVKIPDLAEIGIVVDDIISDDARAAEIVRDVRALFKRGEAKQSSVDVRELLLDVRRIVKADARIKNISLSIETPDSIQPVRGDKTHLIQAVLNLVFNAFDSVCASDGPREVSLLAGGREPGHVHVSVRDSGLGIAPTVMPHLFDPFFTTKSNGMGMGLAIVRSIIENHGGRIWAASNPDRGATLEFELPVEQDRVHVE